MEIFTFFKVFKYFPLVIEVSKLLLVLFNQNHTFSGRVVDDVYKALIFQRVYQLIRNILHKHYVFLLKQSLHSFQLCAVFQKIFCEVA